MPVEVPGRIMKGCQQPSLLLWLTAAVAMNTLGSHAAADDKLQLKADKPLQVIPHSGNSSNVTKLVLEGNLITLNEEDSLALASYPRLEELHLDGNQVTHIPAKYFSVVPQLRVLSLSRNNISSLDPESFSDLNVLTELDLSHNLLTSLHIQLFSQLLGIQVLNLQGNPWNCSCPLLSSIGEGEAPALTKGGPHVICSSLESKAARDFLQATAVCKLSTPRNFTTDRPKPTTTVNFQQPLSPSTVLKTTLTSQNHTKKDQTPARGNTWKFTASVAALALCTCMLIVCAIKGPSWYKLCHDYRHRRLRQEEEEHVVSVFTKTGRYTSHQTFTFERENGWIEEEEEEGGEGDEDGYFEDPYIKREE